MNLTRWTEGIQPTWVTEIQFGAPGKSLSICQHLVKPFSLRLGYSLHTASLHSWSKAELTQSLCGNEGPFIMCKSLKRIYKPNDAQKSSLWLIKSSHGESESPSAGNMGSTFQEGAHQRQPVSIGREGDHLLHQQELQNSLHGFKSLLSAHLRWMCIVAPSGKASSSRGWCQQIPSHQECLRDFTVCAQWWH